MNNGTTSESAQKRIVILGGGFGGVYAALHLERLLARAPEVEICLVWPISKLADGPFVPLLDFNFLELRSSLFLTPKQMRI